MSRKFVSMVFLQVEANNQRQTAAEAALAQSVACQTRLRRENGFGLGDARNLRPNRQVLRRQTFRFS